MLQRYSKMLCLFKGQYSRIFIFFGVYTVNEGPVRIQYKCLVPIYVFPKMKQNYIVLSPSTYHHISVRDLYRSAYSAAGKYVDRSWLNVNRSQTHECGNWY